MFDTQFIIAGPVLNEEQTWWNNDHDWVTDFENATTFPKDILTTTLPMGATGIMEVKMDFTPVGFYTPYPGEREWSWYHVR